MPANAVVLYGPPAAGKDTITAALTRLDPRYLLFDKLKAGGGQLNGYRPSTDAEIDRLGEAGLLLHDSRRYGNRYAVDRPHLDELVAAGRIPIIHMGQIVGVRAVLRHPARWLPVVLWCSRDTAALRLAQRGSADVEARLAAWDETLADLAGEEPTRSYLRIDTEHHDPESAAMLIHARTLAGGPAPLDP